MILSATFFSGLIWVALCLAVAVPLILIGLFIKDFISNQVW